MSGSDGKYPCKLTVMLSEVHLLAGSVGIRYKNIFPLREYKYYIRAELEDVHSTSTTRQKNVNPALYLYAAVSVKQCQVPTARYRRVLSA